MKKILYLFILGIWGFVAGCSLFYLFIPGSYMPLKVASVLGAVLSFPVARKAFKELRP